MHITQRFNRATRATVATATLALTAGLIGSGLTLSAMAADWVPGLENVITLANNPTGARVAVAPDGTAYAVWRMTENGFTQIQVSTRKVGGTWSDVLQPAPSGNSITPDVMVNGHGDAVATWRTSIDGASVLYVSRYNEQYQDWSQIVVTLPGESAYDPAVAVDDAGTIFAAWRSSDDLLRRAIIPVGGPVKRDVVSFETPVGLDLAVTPGGAATLLWTEGTSPSVKVQSTTYTKSTFGGVDTIDTDAVSGDVEVAVSKTGVAVAAYTLNAGQQGLFVLGSRRTGGAWDSPSTLSNNGEDSYDPAVGIDGAGKIVVAWKTTSAKLQIATRAQGDWADAVNIPTPTAPFDAIVVMNDRGDAAVQWTTGSNTMRLATRPKGAPGFSVAGMMASNTLLVSNRGAAIDPQGNVAVISAIARPNSQGDIFVRVFDMAGPTAKVTKPVGPRLTSTKIPLTWKGVDRFSAIATFDLQAKSAPFNGGFGPLVLLKNNTAATTTTYAAKPGRTYCFRVTATDAAANTGAPSGFRCATTPVDDRKPAAVGFAKKTGPGYYLGTFRQATAQGSTLTLTGVKVRSLGLLVAKGPGQGSIAVFFNGHKLGTWSLAAGTSKTKQQIAIKKFASVQTGTLVIKVVSSGKPVRIDGIHVTR